MSRVLVIVDVQEQFSKFMQNDLVDELYDYSEKFEKVYQIWDSNKNQIAPTYEFPNQVNSIKKKFGRNHFNNKVQKFTQDVEDVSEEGTTFKLTKKKGYIVRVDNNHQWFYVNPEITDLIEELKDDEIVLVGGADGECLEDIKVAFEAFGLNYRFNKKYIYSAKTDKNDSVNESNQYEYETIIYKVISELDKKIILNYLYDNNFPEININPAFPYYLFIHIKIKQLGYDNGTSVERFNSFQGYLDNFSFSVDPNLYDKNNFYLVKTIIETGRLGPNYKSKADRIVESNDDSVNEAVQYEYKYIGYKINDSEESVNIQEYLIGQDILFNNREEGIQDFIYFPIYFWVNILEKFYEQTMDDEIYSEDDPHIYTNDDLKIFKNIIETGSKIIRPSYKPRILESVVDNLKKRLNNQKLSAIIVRIEGIEQSNMLKDILRPFNLFTSELQIMTNYGYSLIYLKNHSDDTVYSNVYQGNIYNCGYEFVESGRYIEDESLINSIILDMADKSAPIKINSILSGVANAKSMYAPRIVESNNKINQKNIKKILDSEYFFVITKNKELSHLVEEFLIKELNCYWEDHLNDSDIRFVDSIYEFNNLNDDEGIVIMSSNNEISFNLLDEFNQMLEDEGLNYDDYNIIYINDDDDIKNLKFSIKTPSYKPRQIVESLDYDKYYYIKELIDEGVSLNIITEDKESALKLEDILLDSLDYNYTYRDSSKDRFVEIFYDKYIKDSNVKLLFNIFGDKKFYLKFRETIINHISVAIYPREKELVYKILNYNIPSYKPREIIRESIENYEFNCIVIAIYVEDDRDDRNKLIRILNLANEYNIKLYESDETIEEWVDNEMSYRKDDWYLRLYLKTNKINCGLLYNLVRNSISNNTNYDKVYTLDDYQKIYNILRVGYEGPSYKPKTIVESFKEDDKIGNEYWFEYHCFESPKSSDADVWYHSHQKVKVLKRGEDDHDEFPDEPKVYSVQFEDGLIYDVFDDELMDSQDEFYRPDPPLNEGNAMDYLKPKPEDEIEDALEDIIGQLVDRTLSMYPEHYDDWLDTYNKFIKFKDDIKNYIENGESIDDILNRIVIGSW